METKLYILKDCVQRFKSFQEMKYTIDAAYMKLADIGDTICAGENWKVELEEELSR